MADPDVAGSPSRTDTFGRGLPSYGGEVTLRPKAMMQASGAGVMAAIPDTYLSVVL